MFRECNEYAMHRSLLREKIDIEHLRYFDEVVTRLREEESPGQIIRPVEIVERRSCKRNSAAAPAGVMALPRHHSSPQHRCLKQHQSRSKGALPSQFTEVQTGDGWVSPGELNIRCHLYNAVRWEGVDGRNPQGKVLVCRHARTHARAHATHLVHADAQNKRKYSNRTRLCVFRLRHFINPPQRYSISWSMGRSLHV